MKSVYVTVNGTSEIQPLIITKCVVYTRSKTSLIICHYVVKLLNPYEPSGYFMYHTVVTIYTTSLTSNSTLCPHSVCFLWISEQTAIISLYIINWLVCITETVCVYCAVRTGSLTALISTINSFLVRIFIQFARQANNSTLRSQYAKHCTSHSRPASGTAATVPSTLHPTPSLFLGSYFSDNSLARFTRTGSTTVGAIRVGKCPASVGSFRFIKHTSPQSAGRHNSADIPCQTRWYDRVTFVRPTMNCTDLLATMTTATCRGALLVHSIE